MQTECNVRNGKGIKLHEKPEMDSGVDLGRITATTVIGDKIKNQKGEDLGKIEDIVLDLTRGTVSYLVLSSGGLLGIGDKFFAVALDALTYEIKERVFYLDMDKKTLKKYRGFDKYNWPDTAEWPPDYVRSDTRKK